MEEAPMAARCRDLLAVSTLALLATLGVSRSAHGHCTPDTLTMSCMPGSHVHVFSPTAIDPDTIPADEWTFRRLPPNTVMLASTMASADGTNETVTYELTPEQPERRAGVFVRNLRYAQPGLRLGFPGDGLRPGATMDLGAVGSGGKPGRMRLTAVSQGSVLLSLSAWDVPAGRVVVEAHHAGVVGNRRELGVGSNLMFVDRAPSRVYVEETLNETRWVIGFARNTTGWVRPGCGAGTTVALDAIHVIAKRTTPLSAPLRPHSAFSFSAQGIPRVHMRVADREAR
jgi:hypothetical protein